MRYFLIASIAFHAVLFTAWNRHELTGYTGNPLSISLLVNNNVSQQTAHKNPSIKQHTENSRSDVLAENFSPPARTDIVTTKNEHAVRQNPDTTNIKTDDLRNNAEDRLLTTQASALPEPGTQIQAYLRHAFIPYFSYPKLAQKKGWQGTVELAVNIDAQGLLTRVRIVHSSGYGILDHAALSSIRQVKALPDTLQWLNQQGIEVNFPVKYQLIDT